VHRLPPGVRPERNQPPGGQGGPGPNRSRPRRARPGRGRRRIRMVPVRQPRRALGHQARARVREGRATASGLADHLLLRRQEASRPGHRTSGARRRARPDRPCRRRPRRSHSRGDHRPRGAGPLPVQHDRRTLRAVRIYPRPAGWQARMDREQGDRRGVSTSPARPLSSPPDPGLARGVTPTGVPLSDRFAGRSPSRVPRQIYQEQTVCHGRHHHGQSSDQHPRPDPRGRGFPASERRPGHPRRPDSHAP